MVNKVVVVVVTLLSAGLTGCFPSESPHVYNVHTVVPGVLVRGGQPDERGMRELRDQFGIKTVINFNNRSPKSEAGVAACLGLNYLPLPDNPFVEKGDRELHLSFLKTVRDAQRNAPVYVHCRTGSDRVGLAVAVYRIVECGWDADCALAELRDYQPYHMEVFFHRYPAILRDVEQHRSDWLRWLDEMPDPPVQRPTQRASSENSVFTTETRRTRRKEKTNNSFEQSVVFFQGGKATPSSFDDSSSL
jgi:hypothetical protein